jgi:hypothetical protein
MEFRKPEPFYFEWPIATGSSFQEVVLQLNALPIEQVFLFWGVIITFAIIFLIFLDPKNRWKILKAVLRATFLFIFLILVLKGLARSTALSVFAGNAAAQDAMKNLNDGGMPTYTPPAEIPWISYLVSLAILLGSIFIGWWLWKIGTRSHPGLIRDDIANIARDTLNQISDGRDFGDSVTTCYMRMIDAVNNTRGLKRQDAMTPSEFATRLEAAGLPGDPVYRLTNLFEAVRYGAKKPGKVEMTEAVTCLNDIITACGVSL